jgi:RimJ/RimL family protein N-acetyltransferase
MTPETFELQLVRLRRPRLSDAAAIFEYGNDPEVAHFADWPRRAAIEPLIESLLARAARWESGEEFYWVITVPPHDLAIGGISCRVVGHAAEIGFLVARPHWGRGIATAVAQAVIEWALSLPAVVRVWATCDAENQASVRVLEKAGMVREGKLRRWAVRPNISAEPRDAFIYSVVRPAA